MSFAVVAAALGSFFGLWIGYHYIADIYIADIGAFPCAFAGAFLASLYTRDK